MRVNIISVGGVLSVENRLVGQKTPMHDGKAYELFSGWLVGARG